MGEIADALRRWRETGEQDGSRPSRVKSAVPMRPLEPEPRVRVAPAPAAVPAPTSRVKSGLPNVPPERQVPEFRPTDPAIVSEDGPQMEACRQLAVRLRDEMNRRDARVVAVVSAVRDEGKTTVMANIANALATLSSERSVAIVDLDLRLPSVAEVLDLRPRLGVEDVLRGEATLDDICISIARPPLDVYPTAEHQRQAHELIGLRAFGQLLDDLRGIYDVVIVDTPPILVVPDVSLMLRHVDVVVPVARRGVSRVRSIRQMTEMLPRHKVAGEVLNGGKVSQYASYAYGRIGS